jgi:hypothetical protein
VSAVDDDEFYVHEDEWGMISLEPDENRFERTRIVNEARAHGDAHRAPDGIGWTDIYVAPAPPIALATRAIAMAALRDVLGDGWRAAGKVVTGYSSYRENIARGYAFRMSDERATIYGTVDGDAVASINITRCPPEIADTLYRVGITFRLILCDLWTDQVIDLASPPAIARYLSADS